MPTPGLSKAFGIAVRARRQALGYSQEILAERAGLHPTYISMVERGARNPTLDVAARVARALRIGLPSLIEAAQSKRAGLSKRD